MLADWSLLCVLFLQMLTIFESSLVQLMVLCLAFCRTLSRTPMGRIGAASEIGSVVAFLASDAASYITGETIYADGGRLALNYTVPVSQP